MKCLIQDCIYLHVLECPGSSRKSQNNMIGLVDNTVRPLSPLLGTNDVSSRKKKPKYEIWNYRVPQHAMGTGVSRVKTCM